MDTNTNNTMNPWFSMWTRPRSTMQQIIDTNPERLVLLVAALSGISEALDRASMKNLGDRMDLSVILMIAAIGGPLGGIVGMYIAGALLRWTGKWIGGTASPINIRAAVAWSSVPVIWSLLLWVPEIGLFGKELFTRETPIIDSSQNLLYLLLGFGAIEVVIGVWALVIFLKCLGQVQGFSAWKALGNTLLAALVVIVPIAVLVVGLAALSK